MLLFYTLSEDEGLYPKDQLTTFPASTVQSIFIDAYGPLHTSISKCPFPPEALSSEKGDRCGRIVSLPLINIKQRCSLLRDAMRMAPEAQTLQGIRLAGRFSWLPFGASACFAFQSSSCWLADYLSSPCTVSCKVTRHSSTVQFRTVITFSRKAWTPPCRRLLRSKLYGVVVGVMVVRQLILCGRSNVCSNSC
jgi:hypothetical protein